jgi:hypothetical protein
MKKKGSEMYSHQWTPMQRQLNAMLPSPTPTIAELVVALRNLRAANFALDEAQWACDGYDVDLDPSILDGQFRFRDDERMRYVNRKNAHWAIAIDHLKAARVAVTVARAAALALCATMSAVDIETAKAQARMWQHIRAL